MTVDTLFQPVDPKIEHPSLWRRTWQANRPLVLVSLLSLGLIVLTVIGMLVDTRTVLGESVWIKPAKFAISTLFYAPTLMWLLSKIEGHPRIVALVSWVTGLMLAGELAIIALQAYRGVRSHFNLSTPLDTVLFSTMGTMIMVLWLASLVAVIYLMRQKFDNPTWGLALKIGLLGTVIGSALGFLMVLPTPAQTAELAQVADAVEFIGAHSVGVEDGGPGLPFVGWSITGGDLRIGHFIGLHAMQVLPLVGWLILQQNRRLSEQTQRRLIWLAGLGYLGVVGLVTWQALRGEPLIYPDTLTLSGWAIWLSVLVGGSGLILYRDQTVLNMD